MSDDAAFVDTNILVYALDRSVSPKKTIAERLLNELVTGDRIRLSTQVLQELFVTLTRKVRTPTPVPELLDRLDDLAALPLFVVDYTAVRAAAWLCHEARLSFWDALIVVAASRSRAKVLYTEDLSDGQVILGVEVVNPFRAERLF